MRESCKPKRTTEAPWGVWDMPVATTTYAAAYMKPGPKANNPPIRPKEQHPWTTQAPFDTRSTAQEAFQYHKQATSSARHKPIREYEPMEWRKLRRPTRPRTFHTMLRKEPFERAEGLTAPSSTRARRRRTRSRAALLLRPRAPMYLREAVRHGALQLHLHVTRSIHLPPGATVRRRGSRNRHGRRWHTRLSACGTTESWRSRARAGASTRPSGSLHLFCCDRNVRT